MFEGAKERIKPIYGFIVALICLTPLGLLATGEAWGEWSADDIKNVVTGGKELGYVPEGMQNGFSFGGIIPDYSIGGLPEFVGYIMSAIAGVALTIILFKIISSLKKNKPSAEKDVHHA